MKNIILFLFVATLVFGCKEKAKETSVIANETVLESTENIQEEWEVLFDGSSFDHWKGYLTDSIGAPWKLEKGAMVFYPPEERNNDAGYDLVTKQEFTDFVLSLEWKISEGGNSGIFWGVHEDEKYKKTYATGPEIQVLDNNGHPDAKAGTTHQAGALYDMIAPSSDVTKPVGEWNTCIITINHKANLGNVVLNGEKIVSFPLDNEEWDTMVSKSKFAGWDGFGEFTTGKIGLQDHGNIVAYRNIKIKRL